MVAFKVLGMRRRRRRRICSTVKSKLAPNSKIAFVNKTTWTVSFKFFKFGFPLTVG